MVKIKIDDDVIEMECTGDENQINLEMSYLIETGLMHLKMSGYSKMECAAVALSAIGRAFS